MGSPTKPRAQACGRRDVENRACPFVECQRRVPTDDLGGVRYEHAPLTPEPHVGPPALGVRDAASPPARPAPAPRPQSPEKGLPPSGSHYADIGGARVHYVD